MTFPTPQPPETAKQFMLCVTVFTVSIYLLLSEIRSLQSLGMILLGTASLLSCSEQKAAKMIPMWLFIFACFMAVHLGEVIEPTQGAPVCLKYHHAFDFVMTGIWGVGVFLWYRKWRASRSDKQP